MDRKMFKLPFNPENMPDWPCPSCGKGILELEAETFQKHELKPSQDARADPDWEPEWIEYVYSCTLKCSKQKCQEIVYSGGTGSVDWESTDETYTKEYYEYFLPSFFLPPLTIMRIPDGCPLTVTKPLLDSFKLLFASPGAAANQVRIAIEELLTDRGVKRTEISKGKRKILSLHQRILLLPDRYDSLKDVVLAIKWLGNAGSHAQGVIRIDDVLDCYEFSEHLLEEIYGERTSTLKARARKINKRKGRPT